MCQSIVLCFVRAARSAFILVVVAFSYTDVAAMPMFARKYGMSCATCHTSSPRLNQTGYRFRAAGFRMPSQIGKKDEESSFDILNYFSGRIQVRAEANRTRAGDTRRTSHLLMLQALEMYPFTGSWGRYLSTSFKVTFTPLLSPTYAIENAHAKVNVGNGKRFFGARVGIFHPYDGYGASDSPATISRPLIQTTSSNSNQTTFFRTWGFDQTGVEAGFDYGKTSIRVAALNGLVLSNRGRGVTASAAQGGALTQRSIGGGDHDGADYQVFVNHVLHPDGGGVSLQYYRGNLALPDASTGGFFRNRFDRVGVYGSYPVARRLHLYTGYQHGRDRTAASSRFSSGGAFVEASVPVTELSAAGVRYDWVDPATGRPGNEVRAVTAYANTWFREQFRIVAEYQHRNTRRGAVLPAQRDDAFQVRFIYIK
ncbi:MAG: hypothetical protein M3R15_06850 [Acidobacteriota bacterium]|nr:hypothetical protein [Acidobacteriota bacterium]